MGAVVNRPAVLAALVALQIICMFFFVGQIVVDVLGLSATPISWHVHELIEIGAAVGLLLGTAAAGLAWSAARRRTAEVEDKLRAASGAFSELLYERFGDWRLTAAERDVALFLVKGLSTQEIAGLRQTSEGTVKAQTNSIYRKADVGGRAQLVSLFVEDLMQDSLLARR